MTKKEENIIPAGDFSSWLNRFSQAQISHEIVEVPCGDCRACCTSSYFIHIKPSEIQTLAKIPKKLLFDAPGLSKGNVLLGYDENGLCPMFIDNKCSIYKNRPQTCRAYDCRIFPAAGLSAGENKPLIAEQAGRWQFTFAAEQDNKLISAVKNAAEFLRKYAEFFPDGFVPKNAAQQAVLAIKVYKVFFEKSNKLVQDKEEDQVQDIAKEVIAALKQFEQDA